ncbi:MAG: hypothetical protein WD431_09485 [Cyclobacteriaceae bacterium]
MNSSDLDIAYGTNAAKALGATLVRGLGDKQKREDTLSSLENLNLQIMANYCYYGFHSVAQVHNA